ncbi:MAG: hypothetical protein ACK53Y_24380, partial [bacterium]
MFKPIFASNTSLITGRKFDRCCTGPTRNELIFNWGCRRCLFHNGGYVVFVVCPVKTFITIALLDL